MWISSIIRAILFLCIFISSHSFSAEILLIDDFDTGEFINKLDGINGTWTNNPNDKTAFCKASFRKEKEGYSLKLDYDIDSAITYFHHPRTYILDYSAYSIIGLASGVPHTAFNGFYFLLGGGGIDLSGYKFLVFYVRGDENKGYTRRFQIELKTFNQASKYIVDGVTNEWKEFVIPLSVFEKIDDWKCVTELVIVFNENVTEKTGTLYFDNFYFLTDISDKPDMLPISKGIEKVAANESQLFFTSNLGVNYRYTPERKNEIFHSAGVTLEGKIGKISGRIKSVVGAQEFGQSVYQRFTDKYPYTEFGIFPVSISIPTLQLNVEQLTPLFNKITIGNIWIGYSPYIISPFWGWKGISVSGRKGNFEHSTFLIKRYYNSFSVGNRILLYLGDHRLQLIGLHDSETAKLPSSIPRDSILTDDLTIKPISFENSYLINTLFRFFNYRINLELTYGYNYNKEVAKADYTKPSSPVYSHSIPPLTTTAGLYEYKLFFDGIPFKGTKFVYSWRNIDTNFKPRYRQEPIVFEDVIADQRGHKIQFEQWYHGFNLNLFFDNIVRNSDKRYFRNTLNFGVAYFGPKEMELKLNKEIRTEEYKNPALKIDRNERVDSTIIHLKYNFIYPDTPGLRLPLTSKLTFRQDNIYHPVTKRSFVTHSLEIEIDYRIMTDCGFLVSYKTTRFGDPAWEPKGPPYTDNYLNVFININF